jgi:signal transduction histidine kinase
MKTMNKRLRVLDPLSVSARQRKETFDLVAVIRDSFAGHEAQFARHDIRAHISFARKEGKLMVTGVRGMFVQIIENLLSNSIFWLTARQEEEKTFEPAIMVIIDPAKATVSFADNGQGIALSLRDEVFKPFFSTKDRKRRQGLGLYIARECALYNDAEIDLLDEHTEHKDRLNTFVLQVKASEHAE